MKKKIAAAAALSFMLISLTAHAQTDVAAYIDGNGTLFVSIDSDVQDGALYTVYLSADGTKLDTVRGISDIAGFLGIEQTTLGADGGNKYAHATLEMKVGGLERGKKYTVTIGGGELNGSNISCVYPDADAADAVAALKSADAAQLKKLLVDGQDKHWTLDFDNEMYKTDADSVCANMTKVIAQLPNGNVNGWFNAACALTHMRKCAADEVFGLMSKYDPILGTDYAQTIKENRGTVAQAFVNLRGAAANPMGIEEYKTLVHRSQALGDLNASQRDDVLAVIRQYNDVFNVNFDGDYARVDSYAVAKAVAPGDVPYTSIEAVRSKFDSTVASLAAGSNPGGGSATGGGSGGGGGKGIAGSAVTPDIVESVDKTPRFDDIADAEWARPYIVYLQDRGIMSGDGDGRVRPNDNISREEFVKLLLGAFGIKVEPSTAQSAFADVDANEWYAPYVDKAVADGIVNGISDSRFGIGGALTRQDCAVMICRTADSLRQLLPPTVQEIEFSDSADIADYARNAAAALQKAGVISGYENGEFLPNNPITRAETAKMIYSVLKSLGRI